MHTYIHTYICICMYVCMYVCMNKREGRLSAVRTIGSRVVTQVSMGNVRFEYFSKNLRTLLLLNDTDV